MQSAAPPDRDGSASLCAQRQVRERDPVRVSPAVTTHETSRKTTSLPISPALRARQALELKRLLMPLISGTLSVVVTDNRAVMISVSRDRKRRRYDVRLHHLFVDSPPAVLHDLARYIELNDPAASRRLNQLIEDNEHLLEVRRDRRQPPPRRRPQAPRTLGRVYDLQEILDSLNRQHFAGRVKATITWGRNRSRGNARRSIRLGSCCIETRLIRIHPGLDQAWVPRHYIEWVVFHELLHCVHPVRVINGRRVFHSMAFAEDERRFDEQGTAQAWEHRNLAALLCI